MRLFRIVYVRSCMLPIFQNSLLVPQPLTVSCKLICHVGCAINNTFFSSLLWGTEFTICSGSYINANKFIEVSLPWVSFSSYIRSQALDVLIPVNRGRHFSDAVTQLLVSYKMLAAMHYIKQSPLRKVCSAWDCGCNACCANWNHRWSSQDARAHLDFLEDFHDNRNMHARIFKPERGALNSWYWEAFSGWRVYYR